MKYLMMAVLLGIAGYLSWQQFKPKPPLPPPPPPPAIMSVAAPVISAAEQSKIIKSSNDQDPTVRWEAIVFLDKMKIPAFFDVVFEKLHKDPDQELRIKIIALLGKRGSPRTTLVELAADSPETPASKTQDTINDLITRNLIWATQDSTPEIRIAALEALIEVGDYAVASSLTDCLKDPDERVRLQALKTLNSLQDRKNALIEAEKQRQEALRKQAEEAARAGR